LPDVAWLNGRYSPLRAAKVSVMDRGFLYGDGVYEVIRTHGGQPFLTGKHLRRLESSARKIELKCPSRAVLRKAIAGCIKRAGYRESYVYMEITRGVAFPRSHMPAPNMKPTVLVAVWKLKERPTEHFAKGVSCITVEDFRWGRCDVKSVNLLPNTMAVSQARRQGAAEAIFVKRGKLVEGGLSAIFVVKRGRLRVPQLGQHILPSLTRELVTSTARKLKIPVEERSVTVKQLMGADEVFLASTTAEGVPVVKIDGKRIGRGRPGPITIALRERIMADIYGPGRRK
jgi:D-alanine transaminase